MFMLCIMTAVACKLYAAELHTGFWQPRKREDWIRAAALRRVRALRPRSESLSAMPEFPFRYLSILTIPLANRFQFAR